MERLTGGKPGILMSGGKNLFYSRLAGDLVCKELWLEGRFDVLSPAEKHKVIQGLDHGCELVAGLVDSIVPFSVSLVNYFETYRLGIPLLNKVTTSSTFFSTETRVLVTSRRLLGVYFAAPNNETWVVAGCKRIMKRLSKSLDCCIAVLALAMEYAHNGYASSYHAKRNSTSALTMENSRELETRLSRLVVTLLHAQGIIPARIDCR